MGPTRVVRVLVLTASFAGAALLAGLLVATEAPCDSDEGHHVLAVLRFQRDVSSGSLADFARHTLKGGRYPFLHGWAGAALCLALGPSLLVVRLLSAALLGGAAALAAALVWRLEPRAPAIVALLAAAMVALAPECLANGTLGMLEVPGLFVLTLTALLYHRHLGRPSGRPGGLGVGLAVCAALFTKYPYGAYALVPIFAAEAVRARFRPGRLLWGRPAMLWMPAAICLAVWLAVPQSRAGVLSMLGDAPDAVIREAAYDPFRVPGFQVDVLWFYAGGLLRGVSPGGLAGAVLAAGALVAIVRGGLFERAVLAGTVAVAMLTLSLSWRTFGVDRFLVPVAGGWAVLGTVGAFRVWRWARARGGRAATVAMALLLASAAAEAARRAPSTIRGAAGAVETGAAEREAMRWVVDAVPVPANLLVLGGWDQLSEDALRIEFLLARPDAGLTDLDVKAIRRDKIYEGTRRLDRWLAEEMRWRPDAGRPRAECVLVVLPRPGVFRSPADPGGFGRNLEAALTVLSGGGWRVVASRDDDFAVMALHCRDGRE